MQSVEVVGDKLLFIGSKEFFSKAKDLFSKLGEITPVTTNAGVIDYPNIANPKISDKVRSAVSEFISQSEESADNLTVIVPLDPTGKPEDGIGVIRVVRQVNDKIGIMCFSPLMEDDVTIINAHKAAGDNFTYVQQRLSLNNKLLIPAEELLTVFN